MFRMFRCVSSVELAPQTLHRTQEDGQQASPCSHLMGTFLQRNTNVDCSEANTTKSGARQRQVHVLPQAKTSVPGDRLDGSQGASTTTYLSFLVSRPTTFRARSHGAFPTA